ncbi:hypothetical protein Vi05172_g5572 [Venturia inaequalis]|nr:hypothetical protein Vi05172_g5572 [Venturia inaequalis]
MESEMEQCEELVDIDQQDEKSEDLPQPETEKECCFTHLFGVRVGQTPSDEVVKASGQTRGSILKTDFPIPASTSIYL